MPHVHLRYHISLNTMTKNCEQKTSFWHCIAPTTAKEDSHCIRFILFFAFKYRRLVLTATNNDIRYRYSPLPYLLLSNTHQNIFVFPHYDKIYCYLCSQPFSIPNNKKCRSCVTGRKPHAISRLPTTITCPIHCFSR